MDALGWDDAPEPRREPPRVVFWPVARGCRPLGESKPQVIQRESAAVARQARDDVPPLELHVGVPWTSTIGAPVPSST